MAIINTKAALVLGTNLKYHLVDIQGTDISINMPAQTITSPGTDFLATSDVAGIVKRAPVIGDLITVQNTGQSANEGVVLELTAVASGQLDFDIISGAPVTETAGADINIKAFKKQWQFLAAGGLSFIDGVLGLTFVSKVVDDWETGDLDIYDKMFTAIEPRAKSMAALNGWEPYDSDTLKAIRDMAIEIRDSATSSANRIYATPKSGALDEATDQYYYWFDPDPQMNAPDPAVTTGYINEPVLIYDATISPNEITAVSQANPAVATMNDHGRTTGDTLEFSDVVGMTELNGNTYQITVLDANTFELDGVDSTGFTAYTSGGTVALDRRGNWQFRCLEPGKTHLQEIIDIQFAEIVSVQAGNGLDPKLADGTGTLLVSDATVGAGGIYTNIDINVDADELYDGDVDGSLYSFKGFVDADNQTNENVHIKVHYQLRQPGNINADGTGPQIRGDKAPPITSFLGDIFFSEEFYLLNYDTSQRNNLRLVDLSSNTRSWPQIFTLTITADAIAQGGQFSLMHTNTFGNSSPTYLQDETATDQKDITIAASVNIVIAYSTYNVDGHTAGTPLNLTLSWNRAGFIEPGHSNFVMSAANQTQKINAVPDPSYTPA